MINAVNRHKNSFVNFIVPLTSIYCVSINDKIAIEDGRRMRKNAPYKEQWKNDFYFLAKDFMINPEKIVDIIYSVDKSRKPTDTTEKLQIRAMNKLYDLI